MGITMNKIIITLVVGALAAVSTSAGASAANGAPTCSDVNPDWENHGTHVREDYVFTTEDGSAGGARGGPSHRMDGTFMAPPGASFCIPRGNSHRPAS